ncbi:MAG TPA: glycosyltransferase family protein [Gemmatimonadales bacterium]|nr:glycosyltransferase family protein [Gemmatimonadales bacterium]
MRVLFTIQGEGRGHMTQALAVQQILSRSGHELVGVVIGRHGDQALPAYVTQAFPVPVTAPASPGFATWNGRGVNMTLTAWRALAGLAVWRTSLQALRDLVQETRPDLIINFFEPLTGMQQMVRPLAVPVLSIAHQHMIGHPAHRAPWAARADQYGLRIFSELTGWGSWKLALSLYPAADRPEHRTQVGPPLLRRELFALTPTQGAYYLVYLVNHGYHEEIRTWQRAHPNVALHCFYDRPGAPEVEEAAPNLTFHRLDGRKFLQCMAGCRALASTAGFESIGEAAWLGKPMYLVPVEHHAEQQWNARDATQAGLAITDRKFDFDRLESIRERPDPSRFREWVLTAEGALERAMQAALRSPA